MRRGNPKVKGTTPDPNKLASGQRSAAVSLPTITPPYQGWLQVSRIPAPATRHPERATRQLSDIYSHLSALLRRWITFLGQPLLLPLQPLPLQLSQPHNPPFTHHHHQVCSRNPIYHFAITSTIIILLSTRKWIR